MVNEPTLYAHTARFRATVISIRSAEDTRICL